MTSLERVMAEALREASHYFDREITRDLVREKTKRHAVTRPRQWCIAYILWRWPDRFTLNQAARMFGLTDHTTVLWAMKSARKRWPDAIFNRSLTPEALDRFNAICPPELEAA